jgi:hypothetical protein
MVVKDFCASEGTGVPEDICASRCAKTTLESDIRTSDIRTTDSAQRRDFMFDSPQQVDFSRFAARGSAVVR